MRISGGRARGIRLDCPPGKAVRPATEQGREALYSYLGERVKGASILDLFAGSGAYGLEALSRGAKQVCFVERDAKALRCLRRNLDAVGKACLAWRGERGAYPEFATQILSGDVRDWRHIQGSFDLVVADPPYALYPEIAGQLFSETAGRLNPGGNLVLEKAADIQFPSPGWTLRRVIGRARSGNPVLVVYEPGEGGV